MTVPQLPSVALPRPVIAINTLSFALCFALWVVFGPSTKLIAKEFALSIGTASLLKAAPILMGSIFRMPVGLLTDKIGARFMFPLVMVAGSVAALSVSFATSVAGLMAGAFLLGIIGTSFAVGVQSISSVTERGRQGFALGVFGIGNVGTAITTFSLPLLLSAFGWRVSFRYFAAAVAIGSLAYFLALPKSQGFRSGAAPTLRILAAPLGAGKTWLFGLYYMATFGAFVASVLILSDIYTDAYQISAKSAGLLATAFSVAASVSRMPGGSLSDSMGAERVLRMALGSTVALLLPLLWSPPVAVTFVCVSLAGIAMGMGSAATFKLIPEHFPQAVGAVGGAVGAIGGLAGFFLPQVAGMLKASAGASTQVLPLIALAALALGVLQWSSQTRTVIGTCLAADRDLIALSDALTVGGTVEPVVETTIQEQK